MSLKPMKLKVKHSQRWLKVYRAAYALTGNMLGCTRTYDACACSIHLDLRPHHVAVQGQMRFNCRIRRTSGMTLFYDKLHIMTILFNHVIYMSSYYTCTGRYLLKTFFFSFTAEPPPNNTLFVHNLSYKVKEKQLKKVFQKAVSISIPQSNGKPSG